MNLFGVLKFIHILAAATWVGTAIEQQVVQARAMATRDRERILRAAEEAEWLGNRVFAPAAGIAVLFGILMVIQSPAYNFSDTWIIIGIALFVVTSITGAAYLTPESKRIKDLIAERGLEDAEVTSRVKRIMAISRVDLVVLILIVADMVLKPGL